MARKWTLKQARETENLSRTKLSERSGISMNAIKNAECNDQNGPQTSYGVAYALAEALGRGIDDIWWPRGLTDRGRPAKTGAPIMTRRTTTVVEEFALVCDDCHMVRPTGARECPNCS